MSPNLVNPASRPMDTTRTAVTITATPTVSITCPGRNALRASSRLAAAGVMASDGDAAAAGVMASDGDAAAAGVLASDGDAAAAGVMASDGVVASVGG